MAVPDPLGEPGSAPEGIGSALRRAREEAGFSIEEVAERMRLGHQHIENLESERFDLFPVAVFLRGYLTSYARLVGIDEKPLLDAYDRRGFGPPQLHSQENARTAAHGSELTVAVTTLAVIAVLVLLSVLWWRDQWSEDDGPPAPTMAQPAEDMARSGGGNVPREVGEDPGERTGATLPDPGPGLEEPPVHDDATEEPGAESETETETETEPAPVPTPGTDAQTSAEGPPGRGEGTEETTETAETVPREETEELPPDVSGGEEGGPASLVIRVREDCWLMIRDADQRLVYRDLASAGTLLELTATPPIRIVAGYASGIEIEYNGEPFDLSPHVEADTGTARFQLDP